MYKSIIVGVKSYKKKPQIGLVKKPNLGHFLEGKYMENCGDVK